MNNYEEWAQLVAKKLKGEADLITAIEKDELDDTAATEAFSKAVLEPFLPENFGIGAGRVVDAFGNYSDYLDVVVYNRDFPRIGLRGTHTAFLYESVLATFAIRSKFIRKTFFDAMNACASLADLETNIDKTVLVRLAKKNGLTLGPNKKFVHRDPLHTERFDLIGRPPAFVFGFTGIKGSFRQLHENVELWIEHRQQDGDTVEMKSLPAVIATQGCFAWRNAAPLALSNREMLGIGNDDAPVRLIVLQMLYLLNRRLNVTSDGYGLKPNLKAYLSQFAPPKFEIGAGSVAEAGETKAPQSAVDSGAPAAIGATPTLATTKRAEDHTPPAAVKKEEPPAAEPPAAAAKPAPAPKAEPAPEPEPEPGAAAFDKPSPFASAPSTPADAPMPEPEAPRAPPAAPLGSAPIPAMDEAASRPASAPLGSAPIPPKNDPVEEKAPPAAPLGSAPIPPMDTPADKPAADPGQTGAATSIIPPKPPVDIQLTSETDSLQADDIIDEEEDDFSSTVIIPPPNGGGKPQANSTDDFIQRVKQQLSTSDKSEENDKEQDSFTSTIPQ